MYILLAGINHRTAPIEVREKFAFCGNDLINAYDYFKGQDLIEGAVILATCNRTEVYATTRDIEKGMGKLLDFLHAYTGMRGELLQKYLYQPTCYDAILHLFRVASGIDSMILGEGQIISQVKDALHIAMDHNASDGVLNTLFQRAVYVGKKVRTDTDIDRHPVSVTSAAVELARNVLGSLEGRTVLIIGAGEMSELTTRCLMHNGVKSVIVSNRSYEKAVAIAESFNGRGVRFDQLADELALADIVISCTSASHYVIRTDNCANILQSRMGREIILIDIAVPRDIDPGLSAVPGVFIYDIDDLQTVIDSNYMERQKASQEAENIIAAELVRFNEWLSSLYVVPVIAALKANAESIKQRELNKALNRLGKISERERNVISAMAYSIVNQMLHFPIVNLKEMAASNEGHLYAEIVKKLFALQIEAGEYQKYENIEAGNQR